MDNLIEETTMSQTPQAQTPQTPPAQPQGRGGGRGQGQGRGQGPQVPEGAGARGQAPGGRGDAQETAAPAGNIDAAFEALKQLKAGEDLAVGIPIAQAAGALSATPASRAALERRLLTALAPSYSLVARTYVLRQLALIATVASVPAVAPLVVDDDLSFFARNVLEHIPGPESDKALRDAIAKATGKTRIGIINSVGRRRDAASLPLLVKIMGEDPDSAAAAAKAVGEIGTPEAAKALVAARGKGTPVVQTAVADGMLICVDRFIAAGQHSQAISLLELLTADSQPANIRMAANRTLSAVQRP